MRHIMGQHINQFAMQRFKPWQRLGIRSRLILLLLLVLCLVGALGLIAMDRLTSARLASFMREAVENDKVPPQPLSLSRAAQVLEAQYRQRGWPHMAQVLNQPAWRSPRWLLVLAGSDGRSLVQNDSRWQIETVRHDEKGMHVRLRSSARTMRFIQELAPKDLLALNIDGKTFAHLGWLKLPNMNQEEQRSHFLSQTRIVAITLAALSLAVAALVFMVLGRRIIEPLQELVQATGRLAGGELGVRVPIGSADEIGQLAQSFNHMSDKLAHTEALRKRMVSDVAHELRTPLTGLRCHIESLRDGVLEADAAVLDALFNEVLQLQAIVNDLQELSLAEAEAVNLNIVTTPLREVLDAALRAHPQAAAVSDLACEGCEAQVIETDPLRLRQVLLNVLQNAVKFSPNGGRIQIHAGVAEGVATITVRDHGPGVPAGELENIFERLYRTDAARSSGTGGSGLGLSISRALLRQMGGSIVASLPEGGGLAMAISLPIRYRGK